MTKQECLKVLGQCLAACNICYTECLKEEDINHMRECIKIDRQCAMVCNQCAKECKKHDHPHCKECAQACKVCAAACRELVA
jgi:hypothetical protein